MRPVQFHPEQLAQMLRRKRIATIAELKEVLGTSSEATVFRKLQALSYLSSYSHRGGYYTLPEIAEFDAWGLWSHRGVHFSRYGTLVSTAEVFVEQAEAGWQSSELESLLQVSAKQALLGLHRQQRIGRETVQGRLVYGSRDPQVRRKQMLARRSREAEVTLGAVTRSHLVQDELKAAIVLFYGLLDERQRRLYAGLESLKLGHGGDSRMAELLGVDVGTIARGRRQLLEQDVEVDRVRRAGAGRKPVEKKHQK